MEIRPEGPNKERQRVEFAHHGEGAKRRCTPTIRRAWRIYLVDFRFVTSGYDATYWANAARKPRAGCTPSAPW